MKGIDKIQEYLGDFKSNYVIIGGTSVNLHLRENNQRERATKDVDMIVVCEAITPDYIRHFWRFIKAGGYRSWQVKSDDGNTHRTFYRFINPTDDSFPEYIELFSRKLDTITLPEEAHLMHIPTEDYLSSFSAILMDNEYYGYATSHSIELSGVMTLDLPALIVLKAKAYLNNRLRKLEGGHVQSDDINKHKKDIYRLSYLLTPENQFEVSANIANDLIQFCKLLKEEPLNAVALSKNMNAPTKTMEQFVEELKQAFNL